MKNLYFTTAILLTFSHINAADFGNQLASADTPLKTRHQSEVAESVGRGSSTISVMSSCSARTNFANNELGLTAANNTLTRMALRNCMLEARNLSSCIDLLRNVGLGSNVSDESSKNEAFFREITPLETNEQLNKLIAANKRKHIELKALIKDITARQTLLQDSTTKSEVQAKELNMLTETLESANKELQANLKNQEEIIARLEDEITRLRDSNEGRDAAEKEQLAHELSEFKTKLYAENKELSDLLATMVARPTEHVGTEFSPERQASMLNADIQSSGYVKQLTAELASTKADRDAVNAALDARVKEVEAAEAKAQQLTTELAVSKADRDAVNAALDARVKEVEAAEAKAQQLTRELAVSKADRDAASAALEAKVKEVEAKYAGQVKELTAALAVASAELETTKVNRNAASAELNKNGTAMIDMDHRKDSVAPDQEKNQGCFYCTVM